jgi:hypothetical protein
VDSPNNAVGRKSANNRFGAAKVRHWREIMKGKVRESGSPG